MKTRIFNNPLTVEEAQQSYEELEKLIEENIKLDYSFCKTYTVEEPLRGILNPTITFDKLFYQDNLFFNHEEFYAIYTKNNAKQLNELYFQQYHNMTSTDFKKGLEARIYRTFCGFLTEATALFLTKTILSPEIVKRDMKEDKRGVDFRIFYKQKIFNIHIFIDGKRSNEFRKIKSQERNVDNMNGYHMDWSYSLSQNKNNSVKKLKNNFGVYSQHYIKSLIEKMDSITNN